jgi:hypothetical protein
MSSSPNLKMVKKDLNVNQAFLKNLEKTLYCSTCQKISRNATVSWCSAHHLMCQSCYDSMRHQKASTSLFYFMAPYSVQCGAACKVECPPALSPFVANVLQMFLTRCKFTHNGCQGIMLLKELEVHEVECVYRNVNCTFPNCQDEVTFIGLDEHLETHYGKVTKDLARGFLNLLTNFNNDQETRRN